MNQTYTLALDELARSRTAVFANQGIPAGQVVPERIEALYERASDLLRDVASPVGIVEEITARDFAAVYAGEGRNEPRTPVAEIYPRAAHLALFAVTLGEEVTAEIGRRFAADDLALASMLDATAAVAADMLAATVQDRFGDALPEPESLPESGPESGPELPPESGPELLPESGPKSAVDPESAAPVAGESGVLRYSPGYCGWHISGQRRLFARLRPERIGIALGASFLMQPLKSVSGVVLAGPKEIHKFRDAYPFCDQCDTRGCRQRLRDLLAS